MTDYPPAWLNEPYPLDHTITWREHYARKQQALDAHMTMNEQMRYIQDKYGDKDMQDLFLANLQPWHDPAKTWAELERRKKQ